MGGRPFSTFSFHQGAMENGWTVFLPRRNATGARCPPVCVTDAVTEPDCKVHEG